MRHIRHTLWALLFTLFMPLMAVAQSNGCYQEPCPYEAGVGAVCRVVLHQGGSCWCYESGSAPHMVCTESPEQCNPDGGGCSFGASTEIKLKAQLDKTSGPIRMHMSAKCVNGPLGAFFRKEAKRRGREITFDTRDTATLADNKLK